MTVALGGFYGTKARSNAELILVGDYNVPVYAQWKFGKGMVGSFMCDLNGTWSSDFMDDKNGKQFIYNVVNNLMPTQSIRPNDFEDGKITLNRRELYQLSQYYGKARRGRQYQRTDHSPSSRRKGGSRRFSDGKLRGKFYRLCHVLPECKQ